MVSIGPYVLNESELLYKKTTTKGKDINNSQDYLTATLLTHTSKTIIMYFYEYI